MHNCLVIPLLYSQGNTRSHLQKPPQMPLEHSPFTLCSPFMGEHMFPSPCLRCIPILAARQNTPHPEGVNFCFTTTLSFLGQGALYLLR